jgi:hypothetical protein
MNRRLGIVLSVAALAVAAAALAAAEPARAATVPAHNSPRVYCQNGGEIDVDLPTMVSTPLRSERVWVLFHLLKRVNGSWQHQIAGDHYYSNFATFGGALLGGWLPDGNTSYWGAYQDDFYVKTAGEYRVAMEIWWVSSGAHAYEWAGDHVFSDPWNFRELVGTSCSYS